MTASEAIVAPAGPVTVTAETQEAAPVTAANPTHPLNTAWTVYFSSIVNKAVQDQYMENLKKVARVSTLEELATVYAQTKRPSALDVDQAIFIAREDLVPSWETFPDGGCWSYRVRFNYRRGSNLQATLTNKLWEKTLLAVVGEQLTEPGIVCISYFAKPDCDVIRIWLSDVGNSHTNRRVMVKLAELFQCRADFLEFKRNRVAIQASLKNTGTSAEAPGAAPAPATAAAAPAAAENTTTANTTA